MKNTLSQILGKAHKVVELLNASVEGKEYPFLARMVEHSTKWALPGADEMPDPNPQILQGAPLHLPCQDVLLECDWDFVFEDGEERGTAFGLLTEATPGVISGIWFSLTSRGLGFAAETRLFTDAKGSIQIAAPLDDRGWRDQKTYEETAGLHAGLVVSWLAALRCVNVQSIDNPPPKALNSKRISKGKVPLFTYKTLHVLQNRASSGGNGDDDSGRTPPRLHFRRGHVRRLDAERLTWVQPCMVGDKARGMVEKAYALEAI
jgi:hypothetical protein